MIYLVTGTPGAGKTLYTVSTLIPSILGQSIVDKSGSMVKRRLLVDGVPDLVIDHDLLSLPEQDTRGDWSSPVGASSICNWPEWCKPGDVILVDEVQRYWRPRGMGTKPPKMIAELETHRHYGVDFVIVTQHPNLIDQNVRRLVGQHLHIRRIWGGARAVIYEWDGCSTDPSRVKTATSTRYWGYPKSAYACYKSAELHTKPKQRIPLWAAVPVLAVLGGVVLAPKAIATMSGAMTGKGVVAVSHPASAAVGKSPAAVPSTGGVVAAPVPVSADAQSIPPGSSSDAGVVAVSSHPPLLGCIQSDSRCACYGVDGVVVAVNAQVCVDHVSAASLPGASLPGYVPPTDPVQAAHDGDVLRSMRRAARPAVSLL